MVAWWSRLTLACVTVARWSDVQTSHVLLRNDRRTIIKQYAGISSILYKSPYTQNQNIRKYVCMCVFLIGKFD